jgi:hypothetical protein
LTVTTGAGGAETQMASITTNVIPKDGGNIFAGAFSGAYNNGSMQGDNLNDTLKAQGVAFTGVKSQWDWNPAGGGPIVQNKLWFWGAYRNWGRRSTPPGCTTARTRTPGVYVPDLSRPALRKVKSDS